MTDQTTTAIELRNMMIGLRQKQAMQIVRAQSLTTSPHRDPSEEFHAQVSAINDKAWSIGVALHMAERIIKDGRAQDAHEFLKASF